MRLDLSLVRPAAMLRGSMPTPAPLRVLYRDSRLLVVDKPAGLLVHRGWGNDDDTALSRARRLAGTWVYPAHRLDRGTSGVLVFALDPETASGLGEAFRERAPAKVYVALVRGRPPASGWIDSPVPQGEGGARAPALTYFVTVATSPVERCSLVLAQPHTGRLHQIRRHLKHISHPVIGDVRYGKGPINRHYRASHGLWRMALHALAIELAHPSSGERLRVVSELPPELGACCEGLGLALPSRRLVELAHALLDRPPAFVAAAPPLADEGAPSVDQVAAPDGFAPEQHAKAHQIARGEGEVDLPLLARPSDGGTDHGPELTAAVGAAHPALVVQRDVTEDG